MSEARPDSSAKPLRRDAAENRERLLRAAFDLDLAARLATAAQAVGVGADAALVGGDCLYRLGRGEEAEAVLATASAGEVRWGKVGKVSVPCLAADSKYPRRENDHAPPL